MAAAPQVISQQTASQYRRELVRQPPAFYRSWNPIGDKDINERMVKLDAYDAQRTRENNGKHARRLMQLVKEGRLAVRGGKATAAEAGVLSGSMQAKTKVREGRSSRLAEAGSPVVEAAASVGTVGLPSQGGPMPAAAGIPEATGAPRDVPAAKRQRRTSTPTGSERPGGQSSWRNSAAEQAVFYSIVKKTVFAFVFALAGLCAG